MLRQISVALAPIALGFAIAGCDVPPTSVEPSQPAAFAKATVTIADLEADFLNPCTGETIHMTGRNKITAIADEEGYHTNISYPNWQGESSNGTKYVYPGATNTSSHTSPSGQSSFTTVDRQRFIGSGPDGRSNDFTLDVTYHITINANGETTVEILRVDASCNE